MKHVFDVAFITFRYKLYDVLDQDLLEIYYNFIRKNHPHSHAESPVIIIKCWELVGLQRKISER
jgi:hypothetical protein